MTDIKQAQAALDALRIWEEETACGGDLPELLGVIGLETIEKALKAYIEREQGLSQQASTGWRDIGTAPKDGTSIVLTVDGTTSAGIGRWDGNGWRWSYGYPYSPTHWKPATKGQDKSHLSNPTNNEGGE